jgi:hypothetical protein
MTTAEQVDTSVTEPLPEPSEAQPDAAETAFEAEVLDAHPVNSSVRKTTNVAAVADQTAEVPQSEVVAFLENAISSLNNPDVSAEDAFAHVETASHLLAEYDHTIIGKYRDDMRTAALLTQLAADKSYSLDPTVAIDPVILEGAKVLNDRGERVLPDDFVMDADEKIALRADAAETLQRALDIVEGDEATIKEQGARIGYDLAAGFMLGWALPAEEQSWTSHAGAFVFDYTAGNVADALAIGGNGVKVIDGIRQGDKDEIVNGIAGAGTYAAALVVPSAVARKVERPVNDAVQGLLDNIAPHFDNLIQAASRKLQQGTHALENVLDGSKRSLADAIGGPAEVAHDFKSNFSEAVDFPIQVTAKIWVDIEEKTGLFAIFNKFSFVDMRTGNELASSSPTFTYDATAFDHDLIHHATSSLGVGHYINGLPPIDGNFAENIAGSAGLNVKHEKIKDIFGAYTAKNLSDVPSKLHPDEIISSGDFSAISIANDTDFLLEVDQFEKKLYKWVSAQPELLLYLGGKKTSDLNNAEYELLFSFTSDTFDDLLQDRVVQNIQPEFEFAFSPQTTQKLLSANMRAASKYERWSNINSSGGELAEIANQHKNFFRDLLMTGHGTK